MGRNIFAKYGDRWKGRGSARRAPASTGWILGFLFLSLVVSLGTLVAQSSVADDATPIGVTRVTTFMVGEGYVSDVESVAARITVLELVRGEKAWDLVKGASPSNKPPGTGLEYVAARIRFEFGAKGAAGSQTYAVREEQFASASSSGKPYESPSIVHPKPALSGRLYLGDSLEGWVALLVAVDEKRPLLSFGNNYSRVWFRLY